MVAHSSPPDGTDLGPALVPSPGHYVPLPGKEGAASLSCRVIMIIESSARGLCRASTQEGLAPTHVTAPTCSFPHVCVSQETGGSPRGT